MAYDGRIPEKIVFASDFSAADVPVLRYLHELTQTIGCSLHIVHMVAPGETDAEIVREVAFRKYLDEHRFHFDEVFAGHVYEGLVRYCQQKGTDLLAMVHGHHSFISRFFGHSETLSVIAGKQLAVLVFPPDFKYC